MKVEERLDHCDHACTGIVTAQPFILVSGGWLKQVNVYRIGAHRIEVR